MNAMRVGVCRSTVAFDINLMIRTHVMSCCKLAQPRLFAIARDPVCSPFTSNMPELTAVWKLDWDFDNAILRQKILVSGPILRINCMSKGNE